MSLRATHAIGADDLAPLLFSYLTAEPTGQAVGYLPAGTCHALSGDGTLCGITHTALHLFPDRTFEGTEPALQCPTCLTVGEQLARGAVRPDWIS
ncbi:MAG: hypothetical protein ACRDP1_02110 [Nocardioidaceae bacterium]